MKKVRKIEPFNWSRTPTREGTQMVFLADPNAYTTFGKSITKEELCNSLALYNKIVSLEQKKAYFKNLFFATLAIMPFAILIYNIFFGVTR